MTSVRNGSGAQSSLKRRTAGTVTLRAAAPTNRAMVVAVMVSMVAFLDSTVINLALPATEHDLGGGMALQQRMIDMVILAEVAAHTDDRNLLQQMANDARDAHPIGSPGQRRASAYVLARAAWYRDDIHDAMRWLGDVRLLGTPLSPMPQFHPM